MLVIENLASKEMPTEILAEVLSKVLKDKTLKCFSYTDYMTNYWVGIARSKDKYYKYYIYACNDINVCPLVHMSDLSLDCSELKLLQSVKTNYNYGLNILGDRHDS